MKRTPGMQRVLDKTAESLFGSTLTDAREARKCVMCGKGPFTAADFNDQSSRLEYGISGMCQECQDKVFTEPDDEETFPDDWGIPRRYEKEYPPLPGVSERFEFKSEDLDIILPSEESES